MCGVQSGKFVFCDTSHGLNEYCSCLPLLSEHAPAFSRHLVVSAALFLGFLDLGALDPTPLLEMVEQGIKRIDVKRQLLAGVCVDQFAQLIAMAGMRIK